MAERSGSAADEPGVVDDLEQQLDDDGSVCHVRDSAIPGRFVSLCRVPPSGKVAVHRTEGSATSTYCAGCGRPRCPECARIASEIDSGNGA